MNKVVSVVIICFSLLIINCNRNNKYINNENIVLSKESLIDNNILNKRMYVNATSGLRVRNLPNIESNRIGLLENHTKVNIIKEEDNIVYINEIEGKWVYINNPIEGWVFNAYLIESLDNIYIEKLIGLWVSIKVENYNVTFHEFNSDKSWASGLLESAVGGRGSWNINNNKLITVMNQMWDHDNRNSGFERKHDYTFNFIDDNTINLFSSWGKETYVRYTETFWENFRNYE